MSVRDASDALLVRVRCRPSLGDQVRRHVEGVLGWQVVDGADPDDAGLLRPSVTLVDGEAESADRRGVPTVLLVRDDGPSARPEVAAHRAVATRADAVVAWPSGRDELASVVDRVLAAGGQGRVERGRGGRVAGPGVLSVVGAAGGVGTTTVALALGGLAAWRSRPTLVVVSGDVPVPDVPVASPEALLGAGAWGAAVPVPAVPSLRVLAVDRPVRSVVERVPSLPVGGLLVVDRGVAAGADGVLVARRDRAGAEAVAQASAGAIVLLDEGPLPEGRVLAGAVAGTVAVVPRSPRVARAGARRRVPSGLPGSWLAPLRGLVPDAG